MKYLAFVVLVFSILSSCVTPLALARTVKALPDYKASKFVVLRGVSEESASTILGALETASKDTPPALSIIMDSKGGDVDAGMRIIQAIEFFKENSGMAVNCVVNGEAASMAFYILETCSTRGMTERGRMMAHEPSMNVTGTRFDLRQAAERLENLASALAKMGSQRLKISESEFAKRIANHDYFIDQKEALEIGAIDFTVPSSALPPIPPEPQPPDLAEILRLLPQLAP